jgi:tetratricopeptide (TPR) repeat protein
MNDKIAIAVIAALVGGVLGALLTSGTTFSPSSDTEGEIDAAIEQLNRAHTEEIATLTERIEELSDKLEKSTESNPEEQSSSSAHSSDAPAESPGPTEQELSEQALEEQLAQQLDNDLVRLEALIKEDPTNRLLGEEYVQLALKAGQIDRAIEFLQELAKETNDKWAHLRHSHALAMKLEDQEGELDPMTMGSLYFKSLESLDTALDLDEKFVDARFYRAMMNFYAPTFMKKNKATVDDLTFLKNQLRDDPNHEYVSQVFSFLAQALVRDGNLEEAEEILDEGTALLPADQALLEQMQELQEIQTRPYLGVITYASYSDDEGLKLIVNEVIDGTTADVGGMKNKDQIVSIGGRATNTPDELVAALKNFTIGQEVDAVVVRAGAQLTLPLVLQGRSAE